MQRLGDLESVLPKLLRWLGQPERKVGAIAAYALGELRDERAAEPLKRARRQESWLKRERYSEALYKIRDAKRVR